MAASPASFILICLLITESHLLVCLSFNLGPVTIFIPLQRILHLRLHQLENHQKALSHSREFDT
jgi:hypothetical protein